MSRRYGRSCLIQVARFCLSAKLDSLLEAVERGSMIRVARFCLSARLGLGSAGAGPAGVRIRNGPAVTVIKLGRCPAS